MMTNRTGGIIIASMIGVTFVGMGVWLSSRSGPKNPPVSADEAGNPNKQAEATLPAQEQEKPQRPTSPEPKIPAFRVIKDTITADDPQRTQVEIGVFMEERVTEESIHLLLDHLYGLAKKLGPFRYRQHPNYVDIRVYARKGQAHIAWGFGQPGEEFNVRIRKELLATCVCPDSDGSESEGADGTIMVPDLIALLGAWGASL